MGVSTDGIICYGLAFKEGCEFPWSKAADDYDRHGQAALEEWWKARGEKEEDLPIQLVNYCSAGVTMFVAAVKGSVLRCARGFPVEIGKDAMGHKRRDWHQFMDFIHNHFSKATWDELNTFAHKEDKSPSERSPTWLLCSYWSAD